MRRAVQKCNKSTKSCLTSLQMYQNVIFMWQKSLTIKLQRWWSLGGKDVPRDFWSIDTLKPINVYSSCIPTPRNWFDMTFHKFLRDTSQTHLLGWVWCIFSSKASAPLELDWETFCHINGMCTPPQFGRFFEMVCCTGSHRSGFHDFREGAASSTYNLSSTFRGGI